MELTLERIAELRELFHPEHPDKAEIFDVMYEDFDELLDLAERALKPPARPEALSDIAGLMELCAKATPGPWQARFLYRSARCVRRYAAADGLMLGTPASQDWPDAEFTAAARSAVPAALSYIQALETCRAESPRRVREGTS